MAFRDGAGEFAPGFDPYLTGRWVRALAEESRHLGAWVATVGDAFEEAGTGTGILSMDDTALSKLVGEPTVLEAEQSQDGQAAAAELRTALEAAGIDPNDFEPSQLANLDPRDPEYMELFDLLERIGGDMGNEDFAVGFYDQMNPDGMQALMGVIEQFAAHQVVTPNFDEPMLDTYAPAPDLGSIQERLLEPFVAGFARAPRAPSTCRRSRTHCSTPTTTSTATAAGSSTSWPCG